jgi:hypothetical protein
MPEKEDEPLDERDLDGEIREPESEEVDQEEGAPGVTREAFPFSESGGERRPR